MDEKHKNILRCICTLGSSYFAWCVLVWFVVLAVGSRPSWRAQLMPDVDSVDWLMFLHALPALVLMAGFAVAARTLNKEARRAIRLLAIATLGTITLATVEIGFEFYNLRIGERKVYINWLWYTDKVGPERRDVTLYGYIDSNGEIAIPPQYDLAGEFREGLAAVRKDGLYGFVGTSGEYVINPQFHHADQFSEGMARVVLEPLGKDGYINRSGEVIIPPRFTTAQRFSEGLATVREGHGGWGYIDKAGEFVIEPEFEEAHTFSGGFGLAKQEGTLYVIKRSDLTRVEVQTEGYLSWTRPFTEGLAPVQIGFHWGYVDENGKFAISPQFEWAFNFNDGLALVETKDSFGYIDKSGQFVIGPFRAGQGLTNFVVSPMSASVGSFNEQLVPLTSGNGKWGYRARWRTNYCDRNRRTVIATEFVQGRAFSGGLAAVRSISSKWGYIDRHGSVVVAPQYQWAGPFSEGLACVGVSP